MVQAFDINEIIALPHSEIENTLIEIFNSEYGKSSEKILITNTNYAINIAGEQIGYNGGEVLLANCNKEILVAIRKKTSKDISFFYLNTNKKETFSIEKKPNNQQAKIIYEMLHILQKENIDTNLGFDIIVLSTINRKSLNYATFEVAIISTFKKLLNFKNLENKKMAEICAESERKVFDTKYGIAEQFCILNAKPNHAIFFDTKYNKYNYIPIDLTDYKFILIFNSNTKDIKETSVCNLRRIECEEGIRVLQKKIDIDKLCEITEADYDYYKINFFDQTIKHRVKHCVTENSRVNKAMEALKNKDMDTLGKIFCETHISLRDNFEITTREQDIIFESSIIQKGCRGKKMTGYDFSGASIAIVRNNAVQEFKEEVNKAFFEKTESFVQILTNIEII